MKIAILYDTKTGTTARCAELLAERLTDADVYYIPEESPVLSDYDKVVIGGYVRYGGINTSSRTYIEDNEDELENMDVSFYVCAIEEQKVEPFVRRFYSKRITKNTKLISCFGATLPVENMSGISKMMANRYLKKLGAAPSINMEAIEAFAKKLEA